MKNSLPKTVNELLTERFGDSFEDHFPLSAMMPTQIGGVSDLYLTAYSATDIVDAAKIAIEHKLPYRVIGEGTGTLIGESGFPGLIIKNATNTIIPSPNSSRVICAGGVAVNTLVSRMASQSLGGIEFLVNLPGTVGGAIATSAGFGGQLIQSYVRELSLFDPDRQQVVPVLTNELQSKPYHLLFPAQLVHPPIILTATLQLARLSQDEILRRLGVMSRTYPTPPVRALGRIFTEQLVDVGADRETQKKLRQLGVSYQNGGEHLVIEEKATPSGVKKAIQLLLDNARSLGIEPSERVTYLGYYQEDENEE